MTASKTPLVRSAPALTRRLVRPMPAVKMRRQHGRPWLLQGRTAAAPPRCNSHQRGTKGDLPSRQRPLDCGANSSGQQEVDDGLCEGQAAQGRRPAQILKSTCAAQRKSAACEKVPECSRPHQRLWVR